MRWRSWLLVGLVLLMAAPAGAAPPQAAARPPICDRLPDPERWQNAGEPDKGLDPTRVVVHRGAANLAPENTLAAFEYAAAYDMDLIEIDVQQTRDGRYVLFHDLDVAGKTDGTGTVPLMTFDELRKLNVADNDRWRGSDYDPSQMPSLEDALAFARDHEVGIYFDLKESVTNTFTVANLAAEYGVLERSIFAPYVPGRTEQILLAQPDAIVMHNNYYEDSPPPYLYAIGAEYHWFGGSLPNYNAERVAAVHDACSLVLTNVYQGDVTGSEADDLRHAVGIGVDGVMVNNPDVAAATLERPVPTRLRLDADQACLLGHHDLGLPGKTLHAGDVEVITGKGGCATVPGGAPVRFDGDGSALASSSSPSRARPPSAPPR